MLSEKRLTMMRHWAESDAFREHPWIRELLNAYDNASRGADRKAGLPPQNLIHDFLIAEVARLRELAELARSRALLLNHGCDDHALQDEILDFLGRILGPLPGDAALAAPAERRPDGAQSHAVDVIDLGTLWQAQCRTCRWAGARSISPATAYEDVKSHAGRAPGGGVMQPTVLQVLHDPNKSSAASYGPPPPYPLRVAIPANGLRIEASPEQPWRFSGLHIEAARDHTAWVTVTPIDATEPFLRTMCAAGGWVDSEMPLAWPLFERPVIFRLEGEGCTAFVVVAPAERRPAPPAAEEE